MKVAIVILNWNKAALTLHCLDVARRVTSVTAQWIIVDNGSSEPIGDIEGATMIRNPNNEGFAGGVNVGLRHAIANGADYVWLLNNDSEPLPGTLERLLDAMQNDAGIGLASPVILNSDDGDCIDWHGSLWDSLGYRKTLDAGEYLHWADTMPQAIRMVGTALLIRSSLVGQIGLFDENLFAYWEDVEISHRSATAGFRNVVVTDAYIRHACGVHGKQKRPAYYYYYMTRNELLLLRKTGRGLRHVYWMLRRTAQFYHQTKDPSHRRAFRKGVIDGLLARSGPYIV